jgi:hypothetical protein
MHLYSSRSYEDCIVRNEEYPYQNSFNGPVAEETDSRPDWQCVTHLRSTEQEWQ